MEVASLIFTTASQTMCFTLSLHLYILQIGVLCLQKWNQANDIILQFPFFFSPKIMSCPSFYIGIYRSTTGWQGYLKTKIPRWYTIINVVVTVFSIWLNSMLPKFRAGLWRLSTWNTQDPHRQKTWAWGCFPTLSTSLLFCSMNLKLHVWHVMEFWHLV